MKKNLSILFTFVLVFSLFIAPVLAEDSNSDAVTFFESTGNLQKLQGYKINQSLEGSFKLNFELPNDITGLNGEYHFNFSGDIYNKKPYENDSDTNFKGQIKFVAEGANKPFKEIAININGELITISGDGAYFRLVNAAIEATGVKEMQDYLNEKKEIDKTIQDMRGQWIYLADKLTKQLNQEDMPTELKGIMDKDALVAKLQKDGVEKTYKSLFTETITSLKESGTLTDEQSAEINTAVDKFLSTKFFNYTNVKDGRHDGFTSFYLNKPEILKLATNLANQFGEAMDSDTTATLRSYMEKFNINGIYHTDGINRILDHFHLKLIVRNIDALSFFIANYSYKISDLNSIKPITAPEKFTSAEELNLPFLPVEEITPEPVTE
jgi:hypothetical protein